jgi:hypothetical protein
MICPVGALNALALLRKVDRSQFGSIHSNVGSRSIDQTFDYIGRLRPSGAPIGIA